MTVVLPGEGHGYNLTVNLFSFFSRACCLELQAAMLYCSRLRLFPSVYGFNRVVSLLAVGLIVVGSLENSWLVGVFRLSCVWIEVHSSSTCCWVSSFRPHPLHIVFVYIFL